MLQIKNRVKQADQRIGVLRRSENLLERKVDSWSDTKRHVQGSGKSKMEREEAEVALLDCTESPIAADAIQAPRPSRLAESKTFSSPRACCVPKSKLQGLAAILDKKMRTTTRKRDLTPFLALRSVDLPSAASALSSSLRSELKALARFIGTLDGSETTIQGRAPTHG